ncbi:MAG: hypothetical protein JWL77_1518 [Chthonomonadaceae bacterium]|nr:hypothetical protein [Chthonomonadaceae bacterium]
MSKGKAMLLDSIKRSRNRCTAVLIMICLCSFASASQKGHSPSVGVPRRDPAYKALKRLIQAGIVRFPSSDYSPSSHGAKYDEEHKKLTRWEFAIVAQRALATLRHRAKQSDPKQATQEKVVQKAADTLAVEFKYELAQLNGN